MLTPRPVHPSTVAGVRSERSETIRNGALTGVAAVTLFGVFGPWVRSGTSARSSFELLAIVERLGFSPDGVFNWAVRAWPLVPLLIVGAVVACWGRKTTIGAVLGGVGGCYVFGVAVGVANAPDAGLIRTGWGVTTSLSGGLALLATSCWIGAASRSA